MFHILSFYFIELWLECHLNFSLKQLVWNVMVRDVSNLCLKFFNLLFKPFHIHQLFLKLFFLSLDLLFKLFVFSHNSLCLFLHLTELLWWGSFKAFLFALFACWSHNILKFSLLFSEVHVQLYYFCVFFRAIVLHVLELFFQVFKVVSKACSGHFYAV
mgnify:CR=1 FL=1